MSDLSSPTVITDGAEARTVLTSRALDMDDAPPDRPRRGKRLTKRFAAAALVTWTSCSAVLGNSDPWLDRGVTTTMVLESPHPRAGARITLAQALRMVSEFNKRMDDAYLRLAEDEAQMEANWEQEE